MKKVILSVILTLSTIFSPVQGSTESESQKFEKNYKLVSEKYPGLEKTFYKFYDHHQDVIQEFKKERKHILDKFEKSELTRQDANSLYKPLLAETKEKLSFLKKDWGQSIKNYKLEKVPLTLSLLGIEEVNAWSVLVAHENGNKWCAEQGKILKAKSENNLISIPGGQNQYSFIANQCRNRGDFLAKEWAKYWKKNKGIFHQATEKEGYQAIPFMKLIYPLGKEEEFVPLYLNAIGIKTDDIVVNVDGNILAIESEESGVAHGFGVLDSRLQKISDIEWAVFDLNTGKLKRVAGKDVSGLHPNISKQIRDIQFSEAGEIISYE